MKTELSLLVLLSREGGGWQSWQSGFKKAALSLSRSCQMTLDCGHAPLVSREKLELTSFPFFPSLLTVAYISHN